MTPPKAPHIPTLDELEAEVRDAVASGHHERIELAFARLARYYPGLFDEAARARGYFNPSQDN